MKANARNTLALLVLLLLIALAGLLLLGRTGGGGGGPSEASRDGSHSEAYAPGEVPPGWSGTGNPTDADAPATLRGRAQPDDDRTGLRSARVVVRSKSGYRIAGAGVVASWDGADGQPHVLEAVTEPDGSVLLDGVPLDGSALIQVRPWARNHPSTGRVEVPLTSDEILVTIDEGLPLRVCCVDDLTGLEVPGAVVRGVVPRPMTDDGFPEGEDWVLALVAPDQKATVEFRVEAPPGYVAWDSTRFLASIGAWTRELEFVYPLRNEAAVWVSVLDHEGRPADRANIDAFRIAKRRRSGRHATRLGPGVFRLRGVPFFRRAVLSVAVSSPGHEGGIQGYVTLPAHPADRTELLITLPPPGEEQEIHGSQIGMGGGAGGAFGGRGRRLQWGAVLVTVLRHDGSPASGARVHVGRKVVQTDEEGRAHIEGLPAGDVRVVVHAIGLLPLEDSVYVKPGETVEVVLMEPAGGGLDVLVTDDGGEPLPFASLVVWTPSKGAWVDETDGRQRVDPFTDHAGRRRVERLEAGTVRVRADWGGRTARKDVVVREGRLSRVTLVPE